MSASRVDRPRRRARRPTARRRQILDVSTELFHAHGYHATSLDEIAERIGFTKPAIYYYFASKEDILFEIVDQIVDRGLERMQALATREAPAAERLHDLLVENTRVTLEHRTANTVFYDERGLLSPEREQAIRAREREYTAVVHALYAEGVADGELLDVDPSVATSTLLGASIWTLRWFRPDGALSIDEVAAEVARLLMEGYRR